MAMFSKRHYEVVAEAIRVQIMRADMIRSMDGDPHDHALTAQAIAAAARGIRDTLSRAFTEDNPRFDADRFNKACEPKEGGQ